MNWIGLIDGAGLALIIIGVLMTASSIGALIAWAISGSEGVVTFWLPYVAILTGCLLIGGTP